MAKASVSYQKEIVRLRAIVGQMEVSMGVKQVRGRMVGPMVGRLAGWGACEQGEEVIGRPWLCCRGMGMGVRV